MDIHVYGVSTEHKKGEFSPRLAFDYYFLGYFHTDYLYETDGVLKEGQAGTFMVAAPGTIIYHGGLPDAERGFINDWMHVGGEDLCALFEKFPLPPLTPIKLGEAHLSTAIKRIHRERSYQREGYREKCDLILTELIIDLYREYKSIVGEKSISLLEQVRGKVMHHYEKDWTLEKMAKLAGYSPSRFSAVYKEFFGISPIGDLIETRIKNAKLLLTYSNMHICEIADAVGFSSHYYFSRYFKRICGKSPSEYRDEHHS